MKTSIAAGAVIVVIVIAIVAAYALSMNHTTVSNTTTSSTIATSTIVQTSPSNNSTTVNAIGVNTIGPTTVTSTIGNTNYVTGCTASAGYGCTNANLSTYGQVSFALTQNSGKAYSDVHLACGVLDLKGQLVNASSWYTLTNDGTLKVGNFSGATMQSGSVENIASLQCYNQAGAPVSIAAGQPYQGSILVMYTNSSDSTQTIEAVAANINLNAA